MNEPTKPNWQKILIAVLAALLIFALFCIASLSSEMDTMQNSLGNLHSEINIMRNNIGSIYDNVDEQLKKQASLLASVEAGYGVLNHDTHEVSVELAIIPKTVTDDMEVYVTAGDTEHKCERTNTTFTASVPVYLFLDYNEHLTLTIQSQAGTQTEILEDVRIGSLYMSYLPQIYATLHNNVDLKNGKLKIDGSLHVDCKPTQSGVEIVKTELVTEVNGKETDRRVLDMDLAKKPYDEQIEMTIDATFDDRVVIYLLSEDSLGYIHKNVVDEWYKPSGTVSEWDETAVVELEPEPTPMVDAIYDKDGNLLNED